MAIPIIMRWIETGPPVLPKRELRRILKIAYARIGAKWHTEMRPLHFTNRATGRYGYDPRKGESGGGRQFKGSYTARKLKKFGHTKPLVWTGRSQLLTRIRDVRATSKGARVVMRAPALNFRSKGSTIDMREELTSVTTQEAGILGRKFAAVMERSIGKIRTRREQKLS